MLGIVANDADPGDMTAVLRLAAPRLTSELFFRNVVPEDREDGDVAESGVRVPVELPCFDMAVRLILYLGYLGLVLPRSGVFRKLTFLHLHNFRLSGACDIGDAFSSARCPALRELRLFHAQGVSGLTICSESLLSMYLCNLKGLQQLTIVSPMLRKLHIWKCFSERQPVADITAPVLKNLMWVDGYDPRSVQLGELAQLWVLGSLFFANVCYGLPEHQYNWEIVMLLQRFRKIPGLVITIIYPTKMAYCQDWMEALTSLSIESLSLILETHGHAIGSCVFHFLKISTSIRMLVLDICGVIKEQTACLPGCFCHEEQDWEAEDLFLSSLEELCISGFSGANYELAFVRRLLGWAGVLKKITINFDPSATVDEELCMELLGLSGPETCMKIYQYRNGAKVMYAPVG